MTDPDTAGQSDNAYRLRNGTWNSTAGPDDHRDGSNRGEAMAQFERDGWQEFITLGETVWIVALRRSHAGVSRFVILVGGGEGSGGAMFVDTLPEVMDLLARWAPIVQARP